MRIAIIADPIDNQKGGIHVYTREMVRALLENDRENEYILLREKHDPELAGVRQIVIPNIRVGMGLAALRLFFIVPLILWWNKVDAVLEPAHFGPFNLPRHIKRITAIHDLTPILFPQYHRWHSQLLQKLFLQSILRRASLILSNSRHTTRDLEQHYPFTQGRIATIHLGPQPGFQPQRSRDFLEAQHIRQAYWLAVGTIEPRKNLVRLLAAYRLFRERTAESAPLVIVGQRGWKAEAFYEALEAHPFREDILLVGFVPDQALAELYSHAIGLVYPSEYEGFGLPVLEALACGCPVICSAVSSLPEVGGELAYYVDPYDVESIAQQMMALHALPAPARADLKAAAAAWAAGFSWQRYARECVEAFKGMARASQNV
jgi:glycosyltransferase involved in cell wall biosynthesis